MKNQSVLYRTWSWIPSGGLTGSLVELELLISSGIPRFTITGLNSRAAFDTREKIKSALRINGWSLPKGRTLLSISPEISGKTDHNYLLMAIAALFSAQNLRIKPEITEFFLFAGDLKITGEFKPPNQFNPGGPAWLAYQQKSVLVYPQINDPEFNILNNLKYHQINHLFDFKALFYQNFKQIKPPEQLKFYNFKQNQSNSMNNDVPYPRVEDLIISDQIRYTLMVAASGMHPMIMLGPPGAGKTTLARSAQGLLPQPTPAEQLEINLINSSTNHHHLSRPFREPHHSSTVTSLLGGGATAEIGEVTLAHRGILFLDEITEFNGRTLDALRQVITDGQSLISRLKVRVSHPADFWLICAGNPCRCGYLLDDETCCRCSAAEINRIKRVLSGPFLERLQLKIYLSSSTANCDQLNQTRTDYSSQSIRSMVSRSWEFRQNPPTDYQTINSIYLNNVDYFIKKIRTGHRLSNRLKFNLAAVSRTIADLNLKSKITEDDLWLASHLTRNYKLFS